MFYILVVSKNYCLFLGFESSDEEPFQDSGSEYVPSESGNGMLEQQNNWTRSDSETELEGKSKNE